MNAVRSLGRRAVGVCVCSSFAVASPAVADVITVMWDANAEPVSGYVVYVRQASDGQPQRIDVGRTTSFSLFSAVPGVQYCFAVSAYIDPSAEGPMSATVCGFSNRHPTLVDPGDQFGVIGQHVSLQLAGSDPDGQPVSYHASGLPPGLSLMASTGQIAGTPTTAGSHAVTASVSDGVLAASREFTWVIGAASADQTPPTVSILSPSTAPDYATSTPDLSLTGTSSDDTGVVAVTWANDRGGSGTAVGSATWGIPLITLQAGTNVITVTAQDAAGNRGTDTIAVAHEAPSAFTLQGDAVDRGKGAKVVLTWTAVEGRWAHVFRDGAEVGRTSNNGHYSEAVDGHGSHAYRVCIGTTAVCSNTVVVAY
jgi:hypothetical protein